MNKVSTFVVKIKELNNHREETNSINRGKNRENSNKRIKRKKFLNKMKTLVKVIIFFTALSYMSSNVNAQTTIASSGFCYNCTDCANSVSSANQVACNFSAGYFCQVFRLFFKSFN
jgi:hypothetical protein